MIRVGRSACTLQALHVMIGSDTEKITNIWFHFLQYFKRLFFSYRLDRWTFFGKSQNVPKMLSN